MSEISSEQDLTTQKYHIAYLIEKTLDRITFSQETLDFLSSELQSLYKQQKAINERLAVCQGV